jgi:hypothetical protein
MSKKLISVNVFDEHASVLLQISHQDTQMRNIITQELELVKTKDGWKASIDFGDIEPQTTPHDSAMILANRFKRMADEIEKHNYDTIDLFEELR